jgi:hypothetical protein
MASKLKKRLKNILLAGIPLMLVSNSVHAAAVVGLVASWLTTVAGATGAAVLTAMQAALITFAATIIQGAYETSKAKKAAREAEQRAKDEYNAGLEDRTITGVTTDAPLRYIYGTSRVGSDIVAMFTSGDKDQYRHIVCTHAAHECESIDEIYINKIKLGTLDSNGWVTDGDYLEYRTEDGSKSVSYVSTPTVVTLPDYVQPDSIKLGTYRTATNNQGTNGGWVNSKSGFTYDSNTNQMTITVEPSDSINLSLGFRITYTRKVPLPRVRVIKYLGVPNQVGDQTLIDAVGTTNWTVDHKLEGLTYTIVTLDLNYSDFQSGLVPIEMVIKGKKVYDPRTGLTAWSDNPALCIRDYLLSPLCAVDVSDIPEDDFITAANVCDESFSFGKRYTLNGTVTADQTQADVLESMTQAMAGSIVATTWKIQAGKYTAPIASFSQDDIIGDIAITAGISDADMYNSVTGQYVSSENDYVATDYTPYQNIYYLDIDGREVNNDVTFQFTNSVQRVHNIARIMVEDHRNAFTVVADFNLKAWSRQVGERILFTSAFLGQTNKVYRITDKALTPNGAIKLTLKEDYPEIWDFADAVTAEPTPNTNLPNPFRIVEITGLTIDSGTNALYVSQDGTVSSRILVSWDAITISSGCVINIEWKKYGDTDFQKVSLDPSTTSYYISNVEDGEIYVIRGSVSSLYFASMSDYIYETVTVIGKTEPPSDIASFDIDNDVLVFSEVSDVDLQGYLIRYNYGVNTDWNSAIPLHVGVITASPYSPAFYPDGTITILIKAVDTSGNVSENAAIIYKDFGDKILSNLILSYDDKAAGFVGTKTNCTVVSGNLVATETTSLFWKDNTSSHFGADNDIYYSTSVYSNIEYILTYSITNAYAKSRLSIDLNIVAESYTVEYRYLTSGLAFGVDGDYYWGVDGNTFYPAVSSWIPWSGEISSTVEGDIQFRITAPTSSIQTVISGFVLNFDVEDQYEELDNIAISATGTRLPITKSYRSINNVQLTLQTSGSTAVTAIVYDKDATLGALVYCKDKDGNNVTGKVDARIQGVKGL